VRKLKFSRNIWIPEWKSEAVNRKTANKLSQ